jgi:hypothetical protein
VPPSAFRVLERRGTLSMSRDMSRSRRDGANIPPAALRDRIKIGSRGLYRLLLRTGDGVENVYIVYTI